ncbi:ankyrin repeat domain-containing protein [Robbsia sp. Bb-Pol-6]|uniref:Ankyrin repeat domain-containing protein n=1 Tax=Robbsia betulipollinis TaxID=2981849 RepID=A0ABT3ZNU6_9BURK|nr:ankyrin repeat domain-containing protein [Robbsia betulipollinis]MCY0387930.1 ankyrin repeat domain-containing protein [Robbsia betulipollinis]
MRWTNDVSTVSTAMAEAIERGDSHEVGDLLARGAPVRARGPGGMTFLHLAARAGAVPIITLLVDYDAQVNAVDEAGRTPLALAQEQGQAGAVRELLKHGASKRPDAVP